MKTTESSSNHDNLEKQSILDLLQGMNQEDRTVPDAVQRALPQIEQLVAKIVPKMKEGGRLFYLGAGTSGRLGVVDASEIPPTYGVPHGVVIGLIAGGDGAIRKAVEFAEDDMEQAWRDMQEHDVCAKDVVIGIAASGSTPYVIGGVNAAREMGMVTGCITCNMDTALANAVEFPIEVIVGPEFVTGSTRMKSGTAQKLVLNMVSTTVMIQLGKVKGNKMVDMQLTNNKLLDRGVRMIMEETGVDEQRAEALLTAYGSVRNAVNYHQSNASN